MKPYAIATALSLVLLAAPEARADHKGKIAWVEDWKQGFEEARVSGKPIMLFFTADW